MALRPRSDEPRRSPDAPEAQVPSPSGLAVALLRVHHLEGPDGLRGGVPHLHAAVHEGYLGVAGAGRLLVVDRDGPAEHPLGPGTLVWCSPGTVARLVDDGDLVVALLVEHGALDDVVVPGLEPGIEPGAERMPSAHVAAVAAMRALADELAQRDVEGYIALHRAVPGQIGGRGLHPDRASAADRSLEHRLERLAADDAHHLLDAVAAAATSTPACAHLVGEPLHP